MHDLERSLNALRPGPPGDLPPQVARALRVTRVRRRVVAGTALVTIVALAAALPLLVSRRPAPNHALAANPSSPSLAGSPAYRMSLASLTLGNRDFDADHLSLPPITDPAGQTPLSPRDSSAWTGYLASH